jgi:hypothetical protein
MTRGARLVAAQREPLIEEHRLAELFEGSERRNFGA